MLFDYLKTVKIPIVWTFHDSWAFTGHCTNYDVLSCNEWQNECKNCKYHKEYPPDLFNNAHQQYKKKKDLFSGIENLHIVTPSDWLAQIVKESFLNIYPIKVITGLIKACFITDLMVVHC